MAVCVGLWFPQFLPSDLITHTHQMRRQLPAYLWTMACDRQNMWTKRGRRSVNCVCVKPRDILSSLSERVRFQGSPKTKYVIIWGCNSLSADTWSINQRSAFVYVGLSVSPHTHMLHIGVWLDRSDCDFLSSSRLFLFLSPRSNLYSQLSSPIQRSLPPEAVFSWR